VKILASEATAQRITRRAFMAGASVAAVGAGSYLLSACGNGSTSAGTAGGPTPAASGPIEGQLNFYNWAEYDDPKLFKQFTAKYGPTTQIDVFNSNEDAIAKLAASGGKSGYDLLCPTGVYIPSMAQQQLLEPLDLSRIPNFENLDPQYRAQAWDPTNQYSVCKDWGSTGFVYDRNIIKRDLTTWADFVDAMQNEAAGQTSVLGTPGNLCSLYFWTQTPPGDWTTTDTTELQKCEDFILKEVAPYVKSYDSYPGIAITQGKYALSMVWNGDIRQGLIGTNDPSRYQWVLGAPVTELWMDNWCIVANAPHPNAAYAWINFIMDPAISYIDLQFHGYNTGIKGIEDKAKADKIPYLDLIFFSAAQVATFRAGAVNDGLQKQIDIFQKAKAVSANS
jgi:spermidine/putrescine transport system substrate-binding protein